MRVVHLSHHSGCLSDIKRVGEALGFDPVHLPFRGGYNIGPDRAAEAWKRHGEFLSSFQWAITSDTAPLARILLQNGFAGKLIIWICNRFDYSDEATNDCGFPDPAYYDLLRSAAKSESVGFASYTEFEHHFARRKGVEVGSLVLPPIGRCTGKPFGSRIPAAIDRSRTFFIPPYHNDTILLDLKAICDSVGIPAYSGRYAGPADLRGFKGVIHIPYAWSNFALFENFQSGLPYLVPSKRFLLELSQSSGFFWGPPFEPSLLDLAEWYRPEHERLFVYFDSWSDLAEKAATTDFAALRGRLADFGRRHEADTLDGWRALFRRLGASL